MIDLTAQSVLYNTPFGNLKLTSEALVASAAYAERKGRMGRFRFVAGDSSPEPCLSDDQVRQLHDVLEGRFEYCFFGENLGHGGGQNRLAKNAGTNRLLFLNPDCLVAPNTLEVLLSALDNPSIGLAEARQIPIEHPKEYDPKTGETPWAAGACLVCRHEEFRRLGGFDSANFFMYCDDVDLSWRMRIAGLKVVLCPSAAVFHPKRLTFESGPKPTEAELYYSAEARLLLLHKFSRPRLLSRELTSYEHGRNPYQLRAAASYQSRREAGQLPTPIDADHKVATFVEGHYARRRFLS